MSAKMKERIEKLLAKAEGTHNDHERDAFTAKAQRLMLEWGIEEADLEARGEIKSEPIVETHRTWNSKYAVAWVSFSASVAKGMGNLRVFKSGIRDCQSIYVVGHQTDVDNFWLLTNSLEQQAVSAKKAWWKTAEERSWGMSGWQEYKTQREFLISFGATCGRRLRELRQEIQQDATPGAALVLVSKKEKVDQHMDQNHSLTKGRGISSGYGGRAAGAAAGNRASLGGKSIDGRGAIRS